MRLSTKGRYAVMAMADLARRQAALAEGDRAVTLAEIAARQQISLSYLEQLFARLRRDRQRQRLTARRGDTHSVGVEESGDHLGNIRIGGFVVQ